MSYSVKSNNTNHELVEVSDIAESRTSISAHTLGFTFRKVGQVVSCVFSGVSSFTANNNISIGSGVIPSGYRPIDGEVICACAMVSNNNIIGNSRVRFGSNGDISIIASTGQLSEFYSSVTWITGGGS